MYLKVFVTPGARREKVEIHPAKGGEGEMLILAVKEPTSGNRANGRVREIVAERFRVTLGKVRILTGHHSRAKMISINN